MIASSFGFQGGSGNSTPTGVQSVTGLATDNTDPQNPIVQLGLDSSLIGDGTSVHPLGVNSSLFQATLVSGTNIKTINSTSLLGSGNIAVQATLVSGTNIKTINGNSLLGSGDLVISTGLTIGTTAITSGTIGRILFEGTGNVVQESANLFWDNTNNRLSIGTSTQAYTLAVSGKLRVSAYGYWVDSGANALQVDGTSSFSDNITLVNGKALLFGTSSTQIGGTLAGLTFRAGSGSTQMSLFSTGNIAINTTTDSGYKLDVNGTARVSGALTFNGGTGVTKTISEGSLYGLLIYGGTGSNADLTLTDRSGNLRFRIVNGANILQTATTINDVLIGGTSFASKSIYTSGQYGFVFGGSSGTSYNISLFESTGTNGLFIDSAGRAKVGAFNSTYNNSAILEAVSTTQGFLPPRMTTTQRNAIATPAAGLIVYDTTDNKHYGYNGTAWTAFY